MQVEFFGEPKEVFEIVKKGGKHKYYTIFDKEPFGVVNDDTDEIKSIRLDWEEFVKEIRVDFDATQCYDIDDFPVGDGAQSKKVDDEYEIEQFLEQCTQSYFETALWSSYSGGEFETPLDRDYCIEDFDQAFVEDQKKQIAMFMNIAAHLLTEDELSNPVDIGHNFWLNRNGHGAGFWDGDYQNGNELSKVCELFGSIDLEVGDDNKIYGLSHGIETIGKKVEGYKQIKQIAASASDGNIEDAVSGLKKMQKNILPKP